MGDVQHPAGAGLVGDPRLLGGGRAGASWSCSAAGPAGPCSTSPGRVCATCLSAEPESFVASGRGRVHTFTVTHQNQVPPFRDAVPYVMAYVELDEGPRLLTHVVGCDPADVRIGLPVVVDFQAAGPRRRRGLRGAEVPPRLTRDPRPTPEAKQQHDPRPPHPLRPLRRRPRQGRQLLPVDPQEGAPARRPRAHRAPPVRRRLRLPGAGGPLRARHPQGLRGRDRLRPRAGLRRQRGPGARLRLRPHRQLRCPTCWRRPSAAARSRRPATPAG